MHLVVCSPPSGALEDAPISSLRAGPEGGDWHGFWSGADGAYYTRCTRPDGVEQWFRVADDDVRGSGAALEPAAAASGAAAGRHVMLLVSRAKRTRGVLVGTARRRPR